MRVTETNTETKRESILSKYYLDAFCNIFCNFLSSQVKSSQVKSSQVGPIDYCVIIFLNRCKCQVCCYEERERDRRQREGEREIVEREREGGGEGERGEMRRREGQRQRQADRLEHCWYARGG